MGPLVPQDCQHKLSPPEPPSLAGCWLTDALSSQESHTEIRCKRISWIVAQTIVRQLNAAREHLNLIGALPHIAEQTLNGIGGLNVAVHCGRKRIKRQ